MLAQGSPSFIFLPICSLVGFVALTVSIGALMLSIVNAKSLERQPHVGRAILVWRNLGPTF